MNKIDKERLHTLVTGLAIVGLFVTSTSLFYQAISLLINLNGLNLGAGIILLLIASMLLLGASIFMVVRLLAKKNLDMVGLIVNVSVLLLAVIFAIVIGVTDPLNDGSSLASPIAFLTIATFLDLLPFICKKKIVKIEETEVKEEKVEE